MNLRAFVCASLCLVWSLSSLAETSLKKSFDGLVAPCSADMAKDEKKLVLLSADQETLFVRSVVCVEGRYVRDPDASARVYRTPEGLIVQENFSKFRLVLTSPAFAPVEIPLDDYEENGFTAVALKDLPSANGEVIEVFVTANKEVDASNELRYNAGRTAWGSYLLVR